MTTVAAVGGSKVRAVRRSLVALYAWNAGRYCRAWRGVDGTTVAAVGGSEVRAVMRSVIARDGRLEGWA